MPVSEVPDRQPLRSARSHQLSVVNFDVSTKTQTRVHSSTFRTRVFSVAGPTVWNALPDYLWDPAVDSEQFRWNLKTYLFTGHSKH